MKHGRTWLRKCGYCLKKSRLLSNKQFNMFHTYLEYFPDTGVFLWKKKSNRCVIVGSEAGVVYSSGYKGINLLGKQYSAHRVAWAMQKKEWPHVIDHVNGNKGDNRWCNLRDTDYSGNGANAKIKLANKTGFKGVAWHQARGKYKAQIRKDYKPISLGFFKKAAQAARAYDAAAIKLFGNFAKTNQMMGLL